MKKVNYEKPNILGLFNNDSRVLGENIGPGDATEVPEIRDSEEYDEVIDD